MPLLKLIKKCFEIFSVYSKMLVQTKYSAYCLYQESESSVSYCVCSSISDILICLDFLSIKNTREDKQRLKKLEFLAASCWQSLEISRNFSSTFRNPNSFLPFCSFFSSSILCTMRCDLSGMLAC